MMPETFSSGILSTISSTVTVAWQQPGRVDRERLAPATYAQERRTGTAMIIDCHGHYTTAPPALEAWRNQQIAGLQDPSAAPRRADLRISDDELRESVESNQLRLMDERGIDMTVFSPRASFMAHHVGDVATSSAWAALCNELCFRVSRLYPERFVPAAMLPQSPGVDPATCVPELTRCVEEYGAVALNLNADTTAFMQLVQGDLFRDFPTLRLVIPHGGGAVPYHWGRFRGLATALGKPPLEEHVLGNVFFDTCVYHQPGSDLLFDVVPTRNILFASEMIGAVRDVDPRTGHHFDDTRRYVEAAGLSPEELAGVQEHNARAVYPRLDALLKRQGR